MPVTRRLLERGGQVLRSLVVCAHKKVRLVLPRVHPRSRNFFEKLACTPRASRFNRDCVATAESDMRLRHLLLLAALASAHGAPIGPPTERRELHSKASVHHLFAAWAKSHGWEKEGSDVQCIPDGEPCRPSETLCALEACTFNYVCVHLSFASVAEG